MVHRKGSNIIGFEQINFIRRKQYCKKCKLRHISHLKIFPECFHGPLKMLWPAGHIPLIAHPCPRLIHLWGPLSHCCEEKMESVNQFAKIRK